MDQVRQGVGLRNGILPCVKAEGVLAYLDQEPAGLSGQVHGSPPIRLLKRTALVGDTPLREKLPRAGAAGSAVLVVEDYAIHALSSLLAGHQRQCPRTQTHRKPFQCQKPGTHTPLGIRRTAKCRWWKP